MASAISRRPWPTFTTARPAKPSSSFLPRSVHTHTPSARSMTSSSSGSHGWSWVLWVQRCLIASPLVVMSAPPLSPPMLSSAHVHRRDRCRRNLHRPHRGGRGDGPRRRHQGPVAAAQRGRRGARVAVLTTAGFRDLIEIGRTKRNIPALFVPTFVRPKPVVERRHRFEVVERLAADGAVLVPLDGVSVERALDAAGAGGAEAFAVCLLHAYLNPAHERAVADVAKGRYPALPVSCSADVVAEYREFERFSTTVLNAYLQPIMDGYLAGLEEQLRATGYAHGVLTVASSGGVMTTETARRLPIKTLFSGAPGGVSQACFPGEVDGGRAFIPYDLSSTSTDGCLVRD